MKLFNLVTIIRPFLADAMMFTETSVHMSEEEAIQALWVKVALNDDASDALIQGLSEEFIEAVNDGEFGDVVLEAAKKESNLKKLMPTLDSTLSIETKKTIATWIFAQFNSNDAYDEAVYRITPTQIDGQHRHLATKLLDVCGEEESIDANAYEGDTDGSVWVQVGNDKNCVPIIIENCDGNVQLRIFGDNNQDDPTQVITIEGILEEA